LVPNGVDVESFAATSASIPGDVARIPTPRIGFVGGIDERVDMELISEIARARKDWQLIFTGSYLTNAPRPGGNNIHWLGYRPYDRVADYMASFDVCIIPFHEDDLTRAVDPLKLYEYLAAGKPVVSTPLPRSSDFAGVVRIARGAEAFIAAIDEALHEGNSREQRIAAVRPHSWAERVREIVDLIRQHLAVELS
jgi:glycosyltransferase involved in cell wall biosynthesis